MSDATTVLGNREPGGAGQAQVHIRHLEGKKAVELRRRRVQVGGGA